MLNVLHGWDFAGVSSYNRWESGRKVAAENESQIRLWKQEQQQAREIALLLLYKRPTNNIVVFGFQTKGTTYVVI